DDPDNARSESPGGRAEQRINRRPAPVLLGTADDADPFLFEQHMAIRRRDINAAALNLGPILGRANHQTGGALPNLRQKAGRLRGDVLHDKDRRLQVAGKRPKESLQCPPPPRRGADHNDVVARHAFALRWSIAARAACGAQATCTATADEGMMWRENPGVSPTS